MIGAATVRGTIHLLHSVWLAGERPVFPGFVGWNLLVQEMLQCETKGDCFRLDWPM
jgi:hypothetical protein